MGHTNGWYSNMKEGSIQRHIEESRPSSLKTEAEVGVIQLQTKECSALPGTTGSYKEAKKDQSPEPSE